jgi:hypothetical protein
MGRNLNCFRFRFLSELDLRVDMVGRRWVMIGRRSYMVGPLPFDHQNQKSFPLPDYFGGGKLFYRSRHSAKWRITLGFV